MYAGEHSNPCFFQVDLIPRQAEDLQLLLCTIYTTQEKGSAQYTVMNFRIVNPIQISLNKSVYIGCGIYNYSGKFNFPCKSSDLTRVTNF